MDWADGEDPFKRAATLMPARATMGIADSAWAMHLLGLQEALPGSSYRSLTQSLPMLRAVKDDKELARLAAAGAAADATYTGAPFAATNDGPAYRAMAEAMQEAYGRPITSLGQARRSPCAASSRRPTPMRSSS